MATVGGAAGTGSTIGGAAGSVIPGIGTSVGAGVGGAVGAGVGLFTDTEKKKGVPEGVPKTLRKGVRVGTLHNGPPGAPDHGDAAPLYAGLTDYGYLSGKGLHDAVSHVEITEPVNVWFYEGVEGGQPAGASMQVRGPTTVTIDQFRNRGLENEISSIAATLPPQRERGGEPTPDTQATFSGPSLQGTFEGEPLTLSRQDVSGEQQPAGTRSAGISSPLLLAGAALGLFFLTQ
jgi:hypothetical protein